MKPLALVVENDAGTRKLLEVLLTRFGLEVDAVANGSDARVILAHVAYDVLVVDLLIPGMSGTDVLAWLASERPEMLPRAVVLSSSAPARLDDVRARFPQARVIRKPFELGEIAEAAQAALDAPLGRASDATEAFCRSSVRAGAKAGVIVTLRDATVEPLLWFGYEREQVQSYFPLSVDAPFPICQSIRTAAPVWMTSTPAGEHEYPHLRAVWAQNESRALAAVPLLRGREVVGVAGWSFREARVFTSDDQQRLTTIAAQAMDWLPA